MSIQERQRKKGTVYVVHYYDTDQKKYVNRTFDKSKDAKAFEAKVLLAKRSGDLDELDAGRITLREFEQEWWTNYVEPHLAAHTKKSYRYLIDKYILPPLGNVQLRRINPMLLTTWLTKLDATDTVKRRAAVVLQGMLERAVEWEQLKVNPVKAVKKPARTRTRTPRPLSRVQIDGICRDLGGGRDTTLVSLLAYAGLRPGEALALRWEDIGDRGIRIERAIGLGEEKPTKTRRTRIVAVSDELRAILRAWKVESGNRSGLVFPRPDGKPWTQHNYHDWRSRVFQKAAPGVNPYDLRHTRASELFAEGYNPAWIAEQMGHSLQTLLSTYVHVMEEMKDGSDTVSDNARTV